MKKSLKGYPLLFGYLGIFIILSGLIIMLPTLLLFIYPDEVNYIWNFLGPGIFAVIIGFLMTLVLKNKHLEKLARFEDAVFLVIMWVVVIVISATPFMIYGANFTQAMFETTAGYTTTGISLYDADSLPKIFIIYRNFLTLFGGIGLVLVITSTISDRYGMRLYNAEGHNDKLISNVAKSARLILGIYLGYVFIGMMLFMMLGMDWFDAVNYSITALSTGGFAPHSQSLGYYNNLGIEIVAMGLMILGSTNFLIHTLIITGKFKQAFFHAEWIILLIGFICFVGLMSLNITTMLGWNFDYAFRVASFQFISGITTTGLQIIPNLFILPPLTIGLMILIMMIGGQIGSTTGAIKQSRIALALKSSYWYIRDKISHVRTIQTHFILRFGKYEKVSDVEIRHNYAFIIIYILILLTGSFIYMSFGNSVQNSVFEFAALLGTVGWSSGINQVSADPIILWIGIAGMFIGRLELTVILIAVVKIFLDMTRKEVL